jgi:RNA-directed DNA polymerase
MGEVDGFSGVQSDNYWSSTTNANNTSHAWYVCLTGGGVYSGGMAANTFYVWPVRGGE